MTLTDRDKKLLRLIVPIAVGALAWLLVLGPARAERAAADAQLAAAQARNDNARTVAAAAARGRAEGARSAGNGADLAAVASLGKALPSTVDSASLLIQLETAARGTGITLGRVTVAQSSAGAATTGAAGATPATPPAGQSAPAQGTQPPPAAGSPTGAPAAGATASAPAAAPAAGAVQEVKIEVDLGGRFDGLTGFFHRVKRYVELRGDRLVVRGRLVRIDGLTFDSSAFPRLKATLTATIFVTPKPAGLTVTPPAAAASPAAPPPAAPAAPAPPPGPASTAGQSGPPAATVTR